VLSLGTPQLIGPCSLTDALVLTAVQSNRITHRAEVFSSYSMQWQCASTTRETAGPIRCSPRSLNSSAVIRAFRRLSPCAHVHVYSFKVAALLRLGLCALFNRRSNDESDRHSRKIPTADLFDNDHK